jgi:hypothetical protein
MRLSTAGFWPPLSDLRHHNPNHPSGPSQLHELEGRGPAVPLDHWRPLAPADARARPFWHGPSAEPVQVSLRRFAVQSSSSPAGARRYRLGASGGGEQGRTGTTILVNCPARAVAASRPRVRPRRAAGAGNTRRSSTVMPAGPLLALHLSRSAASKLTMLLLLPSTPYRSR